MDVFHALILGITQGLTEFLPVSSTGHLILVRDIFNITAEGNVAFDAVLHLATLLAVLIYFRNDISTLLKTAIGIVFRKEVLDADRIFLYAIIIGTLPAVVLGLLLENTIDSVFRHSLIVAIGLCVGTLLMYVAEKRITGEHGLSVQKGFRIGWFQALALLPGISRSGATISGGMLMGLTREAATRFAFVLSFPVLLGGGLMSLLKITNTGGTDMTALVVGCIAAFVSGLLAIHFLVSYLKRHSFSIFIWYRILLAAAIVLLVATGVLS
ncbi:MAG: undecaprenyl-diphosphatase UppP [Patescibacteria group bacterium]